MDTPSFCDSCPVGHVPMEGARFCHRILSCVHGAWPQRWSPPGSGDCVAECDHRAFEMKPEEEWVGVGTEDGRRLAVWVEEGEGSQASKGLVSGS